ncbi:methionyl-tRNA formyltransferase [Candidatus Ishikawella capsulata]|uniref:Methionyl-tRNA formyltransferase n=1 Tax=Candidatus Ishikawaella capsulata Mpkobe TaxID=476281 RepID=C5WCT2_9ENTR|nr:methionyl-tRNA formyltransferase [Candidatus Ishikawaella capsulata]BAH83138.1 methionyl-tRNA formyltransferase [Candidatus Ishikawaella capsulata Mpkobe]
MSNYLKIIFAGTSNFSTHYLKHLLFSKHQVVGVFTKPNRPSGRGRKMTPSPVKILAEQYHIPVFQLPTMQSEKVQESVAKLNADIMVVVAYGLIIPEIILNNLRFGGINVHTSLLPRWRGAAPIQRALASGDSETGITIIQMDNGLDTGNILYQNACPITFRDTSLSLSEKLISLGISALEMTLIKIIRNQLSPIKQDKDNVTYANKINKEEAKLNWSLSAVQLELFIRAFNPWPISYFINDDKIIKVWKASVLNEGGNHIPGKILLTNKDGIQIATTKGILNIEIVQPANKRIMHVQDLLNSQSKYFMPGKILL